MSRFAMIVALFIVLIDGLHAQTYDVTTVAGPQPYTISLRPNALRIMQGPANNILSAWQSLPFPWMLYDTPVTGYYASDNGYITFDSLATASISVNQSLPSHNEPNNAIFGFWADLSFAGGQPEWSNEIRTITLGTAPDRFHVIMWVSALPPGGTASTSGISFAIVLKEAGGFEIIQVAGRGTRNALGSIGAENIDGSRAMFLPGSPSLQFPELTASAEDDISMRFDYTNARFDLSVIDAILPEITPVNSSTSINIFVKNMGSEDVQSFDVEWQVNNDPPQILEFPTTSIPAGTSAIVHLEPKWIAGNPGAFSRLRFWPRNINGGNVTDDKPMNDTLTQNVFVNLGTTYWKRTLVEEWTGAWCGWCPDGGLRMQDLERRFPELILVALHAGGIDAMRSSVVDSLAEVYNPSYPQIMVDRFKFPGQTTVPINRGNDMWVVRTEERRNALAPVAISLGTSFLPSTRTLTVDASMRFVDYPFPGDLRFHLMIVEDNVVGSGRGYDQTNFFSGNPSYPQHPYYGESDPITGYLHRHVARAILTGEWGEPGLLPSSPLLAYPYSKRYEWVLPDGINPDQVSIVGFVSYYDESLFHREILNAEEVALGSASAISTMSTPSSPSMELWPQPVRDRAQASFSLDRPANVTLSVIDLLGRTRSQLLQADLNTGNHQIPISLHGLPPGIYFLRMTAGTTFHVQRFVLTRE